MMSNKKKQVRRQFNESCLQRDRYRCICCGLQASPDNWRDFLDVHHITDRSLIPNGGYVKENGATLCKVGNNCHWKAEQRHINGQAETGFTPNDLYNKIGSSYEAAVKAAEQS